MKVKYLILAMAFVMALALAGCSANRDVNSTDPVTPTNTVPADQNDRPSADVGGGIQNSPDVGGIQNSPDVGGAQNSPDVGGDDQDSPDASDDVGQDGARSGIQGRSGVGRAIDDIGDAAGDLARGAGNAIGDAAGSVGRAMR